jgi:hypothetical protein
MIKDSFRLKYDIRSQVWKTQIMWISIMLVELLDSDSTKFQLKTV